MSNISQNILDKIKKEQITPIPKWHFLLKKGVLWSFFTLSILIGSLAFSVILRLLVDSDWDISNLLCGSYWRCIIMNLPYFWLVFLLGFLALAYYHFRHTTKGYRYTSFWIVGGSVVISMLIGFSFFTIGVARHAEEIFENNMPFYERVMQNRTSLWQHPERGVLAGRILQIEPRQFLILLDFAEHEWEVILAEKHPPLMPGMRVKILGTQRGPGKFEAREIRMWRR